MGLKDTRFGRKLQYMLERRYEINFTDIFVVRNIYERYAVISIVLITVMLAIELFYSTQLNSFIGCYFDYLPLFIPYMFVVLP